MKVPAFARAHGRGGVRVWRDVTRRAARGSERDVARAFRLAVEVPDRWRWI